MGMTLSPLDTETMNLRASASGRTEFSHSSRCRFKGSRKQKMQIMLLRDEWDTL
jgi:hypothetical protein